MATLSHLAIGGVRSFGPDDADVQYISFEKPFNLILGRNGCGKTTIIEALKFACTGTLPSGQGSSFVRDPKLDGKVETRAQVKLKFVSRHGKESEVTRLMQSTQKCKNLTYKCVDTSVAVTDKDGTVATSGRHADIDELMSRLLGVSKPILNYVIFCHQEDSYWPLDEGKKLKERFDEIFDATKYQKCMEGIRGIRKNVLQDLKVSQEGLKYLERDVKIVREKRRELHDLEKRRNDTADQIDQFKEDIRDCKKEYEKWYEQRENYRKKQSERDDAKNELVRYVDEHDTLKRLISVKFTGTKEELLDTIDQFDSQLHVQEGTIKKIEKEQAKVDNLESQTQEEICSIQNQIGKLEAAQSQEQKITQERNLKLSALAESFDLPTLKKDATAEEVNSLTSKVKKELSHFIASISSLKHNQEKQQGELQEKIDKCREMKTKIQAEMSSKKDRISSNEDEVKKLNEKLIEVSRHVGRKKRIDEDLDRCRQDRVKAVAAEDAQALALEVENLRKTCKDLEVRQRELNAESNQLYKYQEALKDLQKSEQKYNERLADIQKLRSKNFEFISDHLMNSSDNDIKYDLDNLIKKFRKELEQLKNQLIEKKREITALDQERKYKRDFLQRKQEEHSKNCESVRAELRGSKSLDEALKSVEADIDAVQSDKGVLDNIRLMNTRYIKLLQSNPSCPVCNRGFDDQHSVSELIEDLQKKMSGGPERLEGCIINLSRLKERERKLIQLKPIQVSNEKLENVEIPKLKQELQSIEESQDSAHEEIALLEGSLHEPTDHLRNAESIQNDIFELDRCFKESKQLGRQIEKLKQEVPGSSSSRSYDEAIAEQQVIQDELSASRSYKDDLEERKRVYDKRINDLDQSINELVAKQLQIKELVQQEDGIRDKLAELSAVTDLLNSDLELLKQDLAPALENLRKAEDALDSTKEQHKRTILVKEKEKGEKDKEMNSFYSLHESLEELKGQNISDSIKNLRVDLDTLVKKTQKLKKERDYLAEKSKELKNDIDSHQRKKKEFNENLNLMEVADKIVKQKSILKKKEEELGSSDLRSIDHKCEEYSQQVVKLQHQRTKSDAILEQLDENISSRQKELNEGDLKNSEEKFKKKFIHVKVQSHVEKDLQKYFNAFDQSMQNFHNDRMAHINKFIRQLWRIIYKGNDIDFIEIKTKTENSQTATSDTDKKKNYNYRLVQVKNGQEIEMRNRCSAGQKVLACLIIRMALSETFSANCGILTLDEPTTNLDKHNITGLCQALSDIVSDNETRKSFQLVVITHDREFLSAMSNLESLTHYWEVSRNDRCRSQVRRKAMP